MIQRKNDELPLEFGLPVVDTHHHLVDRVNDELFKHLQVRKFLLEEYIDYVGADQSVIATVAVEARAMYRADGPREMSVIGETEFLNGQAAMAASGLYGPCRVAAGIVGYADLRLGEAVQAVLEAHIAAAPKRFKGIRQEAMWDADPTIFGDLFDCGPQLYLRDDFRHGFARLAPLGLSFDAFVIAPQLGDVTDLARNFPDTRIILDHVGNPVAVGRHTNRLEEEFPQWRRDMADIAECSNTSVKLGGLGSYLGGSPTYRSDPPASYSALAAEWRPYVETAVELFGADRCMFESNVPTDGSGSFNAVANAYKSILAGCSDQEKRAIFADTAERIYRLDLGRGDA